MNAQADSPQTTASGLIIKTGARLHCGLFSDHRPGGRHFQGFGMMIDNPGFHLLVHPRDGLSADTFHFSTELNARLSPSEQSAYIRRVTALWQQLQTTDSPPASEGLSFRWEFRNCIPQHAGLGSGTQLALAVGRAWNHWHGPPLSTEEIAKRVQRGKRSCIGTHGFDRGGLLVDAGKSTAEQTGSCRLACPLPEAWRFVLATPRRVQGLAGQAEISAFAQLPRLSESVIDQLAGLLTDLERQPTDFENVSEIVREFGLLVGESFAVAQGGRFAHTTCETIFETMTAAGIRGVAQSSWGPTMFGLCQSSAQAEHVLHQLQALPNLECRLASPLNLSVQTEPALRQDCL